MAVKISNTFNTFVEQFMTMETNSLEVVSKISESMVSKDDYVTLTLTDPTSETEDNATKTYLIPSFWYLEKCIKRIDKTIASLMNVNNNTDARVQLADGTYRKLITSQLPCEAPDITSVGEVNNFKFKSNWFFEDMLNPCLYVTWSLNDQITDETERVITQRYILNCDTTEKKNVFDEYFNGNNEIDYNEFRNIVRTNGIRYIFDEDIRNLPPRNKRYTGTFTILAASLPSSDYNGHVTKRYTLDTIYYTDTLAGSSDNSRILAVGDYLEVNSRPSNTRYKIVKIEDNTVTIELVEGSAGLNIGSQLKISSIQETSVDIEIPVGYDEREVIFIKPIDPHSNIPSDNWSPGVGFFTNDLTYTNGNKTYTLQEFYQKHVIDFGQVILSYAKDYYPSIREAITPDVPVLYEGNFKVVQTNKKLANSYTYDEVSELVSKKLTLDSELENLTTQISNQRKIIDTYNFETDEDKNKAYIELQSLINQQTLKLSEYSSLVNNLNVISINVNSALSDYRVRGFWDVPDTKISPSSGEQKVVKFRIWYRYVDDNGNPFEEDTIPMTTTNGTEIEGVYSNWNEVVTKTRERVFVNNEWIWKNVDVTDPDDVKINQCDIPVHEGCQVEIKVKAISEAGWPSNPVESDWSNSVIIKFEDEYRISDIKELLNSIY